MSELELLLAWCETMVEMLEEQSNRRYKTRGAKAKLRNQIIGINKVIMQIREML
jgi:hypothetical protein